MAQIKGEIIQIIGPVIDVSFEKYGDALYQAKLLDLDDKKKFNTSGNMITLFGFVHLRGIWEKDVGQYEKIEQIGFPSGACLFTSRDTLDKVGSFDEDYFAYHEDASLAWRAALLGINSYYVPKAIVCHKSGYIFKKNARKVHLLQRNRWYNLLTHYSKKTYFRILPGLILVEIMIFLYYLSTGMGKGMILAYRDIIKNRKILKEKYQKLQNSRKISDKDLISNFMYIPTFQTSSQIFHQAFFDKVAHAVEKFTLHFL